MCGESSGDGMRGIRWSYSVTQDWLWSCVRSNSIVEAVNQPLDD